MNMHAICKFLFCTLFWSIGFIFVERVQNLILHPFLNPFSFNRVHFYVKGANSYFAPFLLRVYSKYPYPSLMKSVSRNASTRHVGDIHLKSSDRCF